MESDKQKELMSEKEEEESANQDMWKYIFGFTEMAVLKCAVELGIPDALESHGRAMTIQELSSTLGCDTQALSRVMRFLSNRGIFKQTNPTSYAQTALSRRFMRSGEGKSMAALLFMESSPPMLAPWLALSARVVGENAPPFEAVHGGEDLWRYTAENPGHNRVFNEAMACNARLAVGAIVEECLEEVFGGVGSVVDVGGGTGTAMRTLVKACPRITAVNFDLPHVVAAAEECQGVQHVAGNFFEFVPKADAAFLMWVLHDWSDEECIHILKKCREAIPKDKGKVIIVEAVIENEQKERNNKSKLKDVGLFIDMVMMAHTTTGKERTLDEWTHVLCEAGFLKPTVRSINAIQSVIEAFPA